MTEFRSGQSANVAHLGLQASLQTMARAKQCAVLWFGEILSRGLYRELGYSSINQYAKVALGFSSSRTGDFLSLCRKLEDLPLVKEKVASGGLGYTAARVVVSVADHTNEAEWVSVALKSSRRELERTVRQAKQEAADTSSGQASLLPVLPTRPAAVVPVRVNLEMSPTQLARYEALWEKIRQSGGVPADKVEALLEVMSTFVENSSPRGDVSRPVKPPVQIHVHQCPDCRKAAVQTSKGELALNTNEYEHAACDCETSHPNRRNKAAIPPARRRQVLARDRHRCQKPGCGHTRFLEVHHIIPRARGGSNQEDNLTTLCAACHRLIHETGIAWARTPVPSGYSYALGTAQMNTKGSSPVLRN